MRPLKRITYVGFFYLCVRVCIKSKLQALDISLIFYFLTVSFVYKRHKINTRCFDFHGLM